MYRSRAIIASLLTLVIVLGVAAPAGALTRQDAQTHQERAESARKRAREAEALADRLAGEVKSLDERIERLEDEAAKLEPKIVAATDRTRRIQKDMNRLATEVRFTESEIAETEAEYARQSELLAERVNAAYRQGTWFYIDLLLSSSNVADLIQATEFVNRVIASNNRIAGDLEQTGESLGRAKVKLDRSLQAVKLKKREATAVENELRELQESKERSAQAQEAVQGEKAELMSDSRDNAKRLRALAEQEEAESARIEAELTAASGGGGSGYFAGTMIWPFPDSRRITEFFGPRTCPFHGKEIHPALDIAGPSRSPVLAAASGTIIDAGYRGGYGNTIIIDHGNGVTTLYAHQSGFAVTSGTVKAGQQIGYVGSTGNSTGPHLHFEVRVNGSPRNPLTYQ